MTRKLTEMAKAAFAQQQAEDAAKLTIQMYHCNHLGTPIALINQSGLIDWAVELDPWGNVLNEFNPNEIDQPIRMQGQQIDRESGLFYNRHRYYDPQMGRYITQDPIGLNGGINLYGYVGNPNQWIDPLGLLGNCPNNNCPDEETPWWKKIFPSTKAGWADYLGKQADYFGAAAAAMVYVPIIAAAAPVFAGIGAAADAGAKTLKPVSNMVLASDTVLDIAAAGAPGGFVKDVAVTSVKKLISTADELSQPSPVDKPAEQMCKK
jgi:RHS repeat-associated protein